MSKKATSSRSGSTAWWLVAAVLLFTAAVRIRLLGMPLERDEGEFAYLGRLMLQGIPPYKLAGNMKLPGTYAAYALLMGVFGQTIHGVHLGLLLVNAAAIVLVFLLGRRIFDPLTGVVACATYAMMTLGYGVLGGAAHATHFVVLFALAGTMVLLRALDGFGAEGLPKHSSMPFFWAGVLFGVAYLMKQPGALFLVFAIFYTVWRLVRGRARRTPPPAPSPSRPLAPSPPLLSSIVSPIGLLLVGAIVPFGITCLAMWATGVFDRFWFWTFEYGREYASLVPSGNLLTQLRSAISIISRGDWPLWVVSIAGLAAVVWDRRVRAQAPFLLGLLVFGFAATSVGFYYRPHYFVLVLPAMAMLAGCAVSAGYRATTNTGIATIRAVPFLLFLGALGYSVWKQSDYLFRYTPEEAVRAVYGGCPFPESVEVGRYLKSHAAKGDRVGVMGSEPQIYFYSGLHSATSYIYTYGLMEKQPFAIRMQKEMIKEIESARPRYLVSIISKSSWDMRPASHKHIIYWCEDYLRRYYIRVGLVDMIAPHEICYYWGRDASSGAPVSSMYLEIFERRNARR